MKELVFFLEEESAKALLQVLLRRLVQSKTGIEARYVVFEGKQDLDNRIEKKLRGYLNPKAAFIILRDQDAADCRAVKRKLLSRCHGAGHRKLLVRVACRELEAFYLGDLHAVELGLGIHGLSAKNEKKAKFRDPDKLHSPSREFIRLTANRYQKVAGSRAIAPHINLIDPRSSKSFHHLIQAIQNLSQ